MTLKLFDRSYEVTLSHSTKRRSIYTNMYKKTYSGEIFIFIFYLPSLEELDTDIERDFQALSGATRRFDACSTFNCIFVFKHGLLFWNELTRRHCF